MCDIKKDIKSFNKNENSLGGHLTICNGCRKQTRQKEANDPRTILSKMYGGMVARCYDPEHHRYYCYGDRGISICGEWLMDQETFIAWALANGWNPDLQIDRIDNDGDYDPSNCRFVTAQENSQNRSNNKVTKNQVAEIKHLAMFLSTKEIARKFKVHDCTINRIKRGATWSNV